MSNLIKAFSHQSTEEICAIITMQRSKGKDSQTDGHMSYWHMNTPTSDYIYSHKRSFKHVPPAYHLSDILDHAASVAITNSDLIVSG